jgi:hypothetical protein
MEVLDSLRAWCVDRGLAGARIAQTPGYYGAERDDLLEYCYRVAGYDLERHELTHVVPLAEDPAEGFSESARRNLRRATSVGLTAEPSADLRASYDLINTHLTKLGGGTSVSGEDFLALASLFGDRIWTMSVKRDAEEIAAGVFYALSNECLLLFWWAHLESEQKSRPVNYLAYEVMRRAYSEGFKYFDLGTTSENAVLKEGLARFKESLGGVGRLRRVYSMSVGG